VPSRTEDLFSSATYDKTVLLQGFEKDIQRSISESQAVIQLDLQKATIHTRATVELEHRETRVLVRKESDRIVQMNAAAFENLDSPLQATISARAQENGYKHLQTQRCIAELKDQLSQLAVQFREQDRKHKQQWRL